MIRAAALPMTMPLLLAALGTILAGRAGVLNLGTEGMMMCGALAGAVALSSEGGIADNVPPSPSPPTPPPRASPPPPPPRASPPTPTPRAANQISPPSLLLAQIRNSSSADLRKVDASTSPFAPSPAATSHGKQSLPPSPLQVSGGAFPSGLAAGLATAIAARRSSIRINESSDDSDAEFDDEPKSKPNVEPKVDSLVEHAPATDVAVAIDAAAGEGSLVPLPRRPAPPRVRSSVAKSESSSAQLVDPVAGAAEKALHGRDAAVASVVARVVEIARLKKGSTGRKHAASEATPLTPPPLAIAALALWRALQEELAASPTAVIAYTQAQELAVGVGSFANKWWWAVLIFLTTVECVKIIGCSVGTMGIGPGSLAMIFA